MRDEEDTLIYLAAGPMAAMVLGVALIPLRDLTPASNLTFVFLALTIVVGHLGGRGPAVATALTSALSLDFFLTRPYMRLSIENKHDLIAFLGLALCGLVAAALGGRVGPTAASRRQNAVLDEALRQLERGGPPEERLRAILDRLVAAFPISAAAVRDEQGRALASSGPASLTDRIPALEARTDDLVVGRAGWPEPQDEGRAAGLRLGLLDEGRMVGWLDLWGGGRPLSREAERLLAAVARGVSALLAQRKRAEAPSQDEPAAVTPAWTRPHRRAPE